MDPATSGNGSGNIQELIRKNLGMDPGVCGSATKINCNVLTHDSHGPKVLEMCSEALGAQVCANSCTQGSCKRKMLKLQVYAGAAKRHLRLISLLLLLLPFQFLRIFIDSALIGRGRSDDRYPFCRRAGFGVKQQIAADTKDTIAQEAK